jgi:nitric oxide reductase NorE protein
VEFAEKFGQGLDLSTNTFYMFYFLLTGFHFLHVIVAMVFLGILWVRTWQCHHGAQDLHALESGAAFWHMVDLLWIILFPLVYVMR